MALLTALAARRPDAAPAATAGSRSERMLGQWHSFEVVTSPW